MAFDELIREDAASSIRMKKTPEGYLRGEAVVSRTGVFTYRNDDGSYRYELRHPDDIITQSTLDSLRQIPITMDHPSSLVTAETAKALAIGYTGDNVRVDGPNIIVGFTITDQDAVKAIEAGKRGLSLGYRVGDLVREDGTYKGQKYTHRQTGTIINHLAVCASGRAGSAASIRLDGVPVQIEPLTEEEPGMGENVNMVSVRLDNLDYQAAPEVANAYNREKARADAAETQAEQVRADAQAQVDKMKAERDDAASQLEALKARFDSDVAEGVALRSEASGLLKDPNSILRTDSARQIHEKVIKERQPDFDASKESDDYVRARYDAIVLRASEENAAGQVRQATPMGKGTEPQKRYDSASMIEAMRAQSLPKEMN